MEDIANENGLMWQPKTVYHSLQELFNMNSSYNHMTLMIIIQFNEQHFCIDVSHNGCHSTKYPQRKSNNT